MATQYYTYRGSGNVYRWVKTPEQTLLEKWDGTQWIHWPDLFAASGIGGDTAYEQISHEDAERMMKEPVRRKWSSTK